MALTPEQLEDRLQTLEEELKELRGRDRNVNPFESLEFQLTLEGGHTVSARTRRVPMTAMQFAQAHYTRYDDGNITANAWGCQMPTDWVVGTLVTVNCLLLASGTGQANMRSRIGVNKEGDTYSLVNIENLATVDISMSIGVVFLLSRDIAGTSIEATDSIAWLLQRRGSDGSDTVSAAVNAYDGAYLEYTAFF